MNATYNQPHDATDAEKLVSLTRSFRVGKAIPPIVVQGDNAFTGSHRIAAHRLAMSLWSSEAEGWADSPEPVLATVEMTEDEYAAAMDRLGLEPGDRVHDYNDFCDALFAVTENDELKSALEDQRI